MPLLLFSVPLVLSVVSTGDAAFAFRAPKRLSTASSLSSSSNISSKLELYALELQSIDGSFDALGVVCFIGDLWSSTVEERFRLRFFDFDDICVESRRWLPAKGGGGDVLAFGSTGCSDGARSPIPAWLGGSVGLVTGWDKNCEKPNVPPVSVPLARPGDRAVAVGIGGMARDAGGTVVTIVFVRAVGR